MVGIGKMKSKFQKIVALEKCKIHFFFVQALGWGLTEVCKIA